MVTLMKDLVTWLQQWFYTEDEIDTKLSNKANKNLGNANYNVVTDSSGDITVEAKPTIPTDVSSLKDANASGYTNISGSLSSNSTQADINSAINTKLGSLVGTDFVVVVSSLGTASESTMGKLYLIAISGSGNNNFAEYVTVKDTSTTPTTYSWEKLGEISGSGLSVDWNDITSKPNSFTPSDHTHGNITNAGAIGSTANLPLITTTSGVVTTGSFGTSANSFCEGNDSRLSDSRTPTSHTHGNLTNDGKIGSASGKIITTGTSGALQASDSITKSLISDFPSSMTPTSHTHGQVTNDGKITSTAVTVASGDNVLITDASDSSKVKRVANLLTDHIKDGTAHSNIGSSANDTQATINSDIDTALSGKADKTGALGTTISLIDKGETNEGCIVFNTIS